MISAASRIACSWFWVVPSAARMEEVFWHAVWPLMAGGDPSAVMVAGFPVDAADGMLVNLADIPENRKCAW